VLAFKYRIHDARIGRFLSIDPLAPDYPWNSPYQFSGNTPIAFVELEGLEPKRGFESSVASIPKPDFHFAGRFARNPPIGCGLGAM
jgi:hypothetical protein